MVRAAGRRNDLGGGFSKSFDAGESTEPCSSGAKLEYFPVDGENQLALRWRALTGLTPVFGPHVTEGR